jgi:hypothetical protein
LVAVVREAQAAGIPITTHLVLCCKRQREYFIDMQKVKPKAKIILENSI